MSFSCEDPFITEAPEGYERLLLDATHGDRTPFPGEEGVERAWRIADPALREMALRCFVDAGSWGPAEVDALLTPARWPLR